MSDDDLMAMEDAMAALPSSVLRYDGEFPLGFFKGGESVKQWLGQEGGCVLTAGPNVSFHLAPGDYLIRNRDGRLVHVERFVAEAIRVYGSEVPRG